MEPEARLVGGRPENGGAGAIWLLAGGAVLVMLCIAPCLASVAAREIWFSVLQFLAGPRATVKFLGMVSAVCAILLGLLFAATGLHVAAGQLAATTAVLIPLLAGAFVYIGHYFTGNPVPLGPVYLLMALYVCAYPVIFLMFVESDFSLRELLPVAIISVVVFAPLSIAVTLGLALAVGPFWVGVASRLAPLDPQVGGGVIIALYITTAPLLLAVIVRLCAFLSGPRYRFSLTGFGGPELWQLIVGGLCIALAAVVARYLLGTFGSRAVTQNWVVVHAQRSFLASMVVAPVLTGYTFWVAKRFRITE